MTRHWFLADSYQLAADCYYAPDTHLWLQPQGGSEARCGLDPLGSETSGDVVALSFEPVGTKIVRGKPFGSLEAAKFVGPLVAPASGVVTRHNPEVLANPALVNQDPMNHWLIEVELADPSELAELLYGQERVRAWFEEQAARFRHQGMIAQ